jgi:hypothetical protein
LVRGGALSEMEVIGCDAAMPVPSRSVVRRQMADASESQLSMSVSEALRQLLRTIGCIAYIARRVKSGNNDHNGSPAIKRALQQAETPILSIHRHLRRLGRNAIQVTLRFSLALETPNWRCAFACWHTHHTAASYGPLLSARLRFAEAIAPRPAGACRQTKACLLRSGPPLLGQAGMHSLTLRLSKKFPQVQVMQSVVPVADRHRRGINPSHRLCTPDSLVGCVGDDPLE